MDTEDFKHVPATVNRVLCCVCGVLVESNPTNMCPQCIQAHVDITEGLIREYILVYCPECERYLQPPKYWTKADLESRELLTICIKKIRGLNKYHVVDASFIWTEPHSKKLKMKLVLQREIFANTVIQQTVQIDYDVHWRQCEGCAKVATGQPQWDAVVQLRQRLEHKRTFLYLEQIILKHRMHEDAIRIDGHPMGLDFFFSHRSHGNAFVDFINQNAPAIRRDAVQLVSHDTKCNTAVQHHTFSLELAPLCREDVVCLPHKLHMQYGGLGPIVLVHKVYSSIVFLDPVSLRAAELEGTIYWKSPFDSLANTRQLLDFYILDIVPNGYVNGKFMQADATICLADRVGDGEEFHVKTHLGNSLKPGDLAKGYLMTSINFNNDHIGRYKESQIPDVILVRKHYPKQIGRRKNRQWTVKTLDIATGETDGTREANDAGTKRKKGEKRRPEAAEGGRTGLVSAQEFDEFMDDLERDKEFRKDVNLYKKEVSFVTQNIQRGRKGENNNDDDDATMPAQPTRSSEAADDNDDADEDQPEVQLSELLEGMSIEKKKRTRGESEDVPAGEEDDAEAQEAPPAPADRSQ